MGSHLHHLEREAYCSVLRAFKAQSDAISWEKEGLLTELRKELRVTNEEHREVLMAIGTDAIIHQQSQNIQEKVNTSSKHQYIPDPGHTLISEPRKRQRPFQSVPTISTFVNSHSTVITTYPSNSKMKGGRGRWWKMQPSRGVGGRGRNLSLFSDHVPSGNGYTVATSSSCHPLIGRKLRLRWPGDNHFYEAVISDYNTLEDRHALVYDMDTSHETWEWVDLKDISPNDLQWVYDDNMISNHSVPSSVDAGRGMGNRDDVSVLRDSDERVDIEAVKQLPVIESAGAKPSDDIELFDTSTLIDEVNNLLSSGHPDSVEMNKTKRLLREHEEALINAIVKLAEVSEGESDTKYFI